jgi:predicted DNA-binding transcriptional regulator AlpA
MKRISAFDNALRVFAFINETPNSGCISLKNESSQYATTKANGFNKEVDKTSELLGETLLNAIRLAVREEIREDLSQGGFSSDDRLLDTEEASKVLHVSPDWLYRNSRKLPFTRKLGSKVLRFSYRGIQTWIRKGVGV